MKHGPTMGKFRARQFTPRETRRLDVLSLPLPLFFILETSARLPKGERKAKEGKVKAERCKKTRERGERESARSSGKQMPMKAAHPANVTQAYHYQQGRTNDLLNDCYISKILRTGENTYLYIYIYALYTWSRQREREGKGGGSLPPRALLGNSIRKLCPGDLRPVLNHGQSGEYVSTGGRRGVNPPPQDTTVVGPKP